MIIHFNNTELELPVNDNSYRYRAIKQIGSLTLYYSLPQHVEIPLGAWCEFEGATYTLTEPENFKKHSTRNFEYTLILSAPKLDKYKFRDIASRRLKFSLTAKPREHLQMLVDNLNQRETGWTAGACIDAVEKVISYNHAFCNDALSQIAEAFETEWEIVGKAISLRKVEYNKDNPLPLSYGRGNGFKSGIGRSNSSAKPIEILFVQGGEQNIDASKYGSSELLLPKNQTIAYDGQCFSDQKGYDAAKARRYATDADGFSLRRSDRPLSSKNEDSLDLSHIYPSRVGTVTAVHIVDAEKHFYDIVDSSIPANLDFKDCLIEGETITVIFQSGMLAGKELEVKYTHAGRRFEIVPQEIDGRTMPDDVFTPAIGDTYAVFGMMMPQAYICDNATKSGASWDMLREAVKYLYENEEQKFTFTGELDGIWAKRDWLNIGGKIKLGGYVLFSDNQFQPDGMLIRITGIKDYINNPHSPQIELSNEIVGSSILSDLRKIGSSEVVVDSKFAKAIQYSKRGWRNAEESLEIMEEAMLKNFTESVNPLTVRTMAALVGDECLQFKFVSSKTNPVPVAHRITFDSNTKILNAPAGIIQHMTMGIDAAAPAHKTSEYKFWDIPQFSSPPLDDAKKYYLYAKVGASQAGKFYLSETAKAMDAEAGYYYLWVGFLNSAYNGERADFVNMNRFTEILPGQITVDLIRDELARLVIDLANAKITAQNGAEIIGKVTFSKGSSGYENISDKPDMSAYDDAVGYIGSVLPAHLERLQAQIDDAIESHFFHYDPTMSNIPASDWTTTGDKEKHLDDTFTNLDTGQSWRFTKNANSVYMWTLMSDTAATNALALAGKAQDTADGKRRVFVATPTPPYDVGDLWTDGQDLLRCYHAKAAGGSYSEYDWVVAVNYDNTQTVIDGGLVTTGTVQLRGIGNTGMAKIFAGITADGSADSSVRIWAGSAKTNNSEAPFRVMQDGSLVASNAKITGEVQATSGKFTGEVQATSGKFTGEVQATSGKFTGEVNATSGTFKGAINADGGMRMGVRNIRVSDDQIDKGDSFVIILSATFDNVINLPSSPNVGQMVTIKNISGEQVIISSNRRIYWGGESGSYAGGTIDLRYNMLLADNRARQLIYCGNSTVSAGKGWHVVGQFDY
jgi:hypothetical protein